ncbi:MAG TPA: DHA2 family efflux MFS transporter permease subunit [Gemmatimonadaceae bacterium]|nr:DHA2 family efflux MFS transporter permease subunit [Gemmatimonadaceae bacterium]
MATATVPRDADTGGLPPEPARDVPPTSAPDSGEGEPHKWLIAGSVLIGTIMAVLDTSIVNVALADMSGTLGATIEQITWVVTGYMLSNVLVMPMMGMLSARFGRKKLYLSSLALFTLASMACGLARSLPTMVAVRAFQGIGGGVIMTVAQAILRETFPPKEQGIAMGLFGMGVVLAPAFGPTLGGWLTDKYSWPWIFYINVPIGVINYMLVQRFVHDPHYLVREKGAVDWTGLALMIGGLGALQLGLEEGSSHDWFQSAFIIRLFAVGTLGLLLFVWHELRTPRPAVDLRIMKNAGFSSATALNGVLGMALMGSVFLLPLFMQNILRFNAMQAGEALMPRSLAMAVLMPIGGRVYNRIGPKILVTAGLVLSAVSFVQLANMTVDTGFWDLFWPQVLQGAGFSLIFVALTTAAFATIDKPKVTAASGLYNVVRTVAGSIGVAIAASQLTTMTQANHAVLAERASMANSSAVTWVQQATAGMMRTGVDAYTARMRALKLLDLSMTRQAVVMALNHVFVLIAILFFISLPFVLLLRAGHADGHEAMIAE